MARVCTNNTNTVTTLDCFTFYTNFLYRCPYFHIINSKTKTIGLFYLILKLNARGACAIVESDLKAPNDTALATIRIDFYNYLVADKDFNTA